jgi:hypothetical protein
MNKSSPAQGPDEGRDGGVRRLSTNCRACILHAILLVMGRPLQIRDVPKPVLDTLRERAEERHMSLASYALDVLTRHVQTKTMSQVLGGPRLRKGKALSNDNILELLASGRR